MRTINEGIGCGCTVARNWAAGDSRFAQLRFIVVREGVALGESLHALDETVGQRLIDQNRLNVAFGRVVKFDATNFHKVQCCTRC